MPSSVHSQDNDQSMVDAQNQEHEQTELQQQQQELPEPALEEKRIVVVRSPSLATAWVVADRIGLDRIALHQC